MSRLNGSDQGIQSLDPTRDDSLLICLYFVTVFMLLEKNATKVKNTWSLHTFKFAGILSSFMGCNWDDTVFGLRMGTQRFARKIISSECSVLVDKFEKSFPFVTGIPNSDHFISSPEPKAHKVSL